MGLNRTHGIAVLVVLLLVASLTASHFRASNRELADVRAEIETMLRSDRYFAPRLSPIENHFPCSDASEAIGLTCRTHSSPGSPRFAMAVKLARKASSEQLQNLAEARQLSGLALLLTGDAEAASEELRIALRMEPGNERITADLLAAHLILFDNVNDPQALLDAFRSLGAMRPGESAYVPLLFNWALLLERAGLNAEAEVMWTRYARQETDWRWRDEASRRLASVRELANGRDWEVMRTAMATGQLMREVSPTLLQHVRLSMEDELLGQWAEMELQDDPRATDRRNALHRLAQELALAQRDRLLLDAVKCLDEPLSRSGLAAAHRSYARGRKAHEAQDYNVARNHFRQALEGFRAAGSPFEIWSRFYLAVILHHRPDFQAAHRELLEIQHDPRLLEYPLASAYVDWMLGLGLSRMADYNRSAQHFTSARDGFVAAGEVENAAAMDSELGGLAERIFSPEQAWRHHHAALVRLPQIIKSRRKQNVLLAAGEFMQGQGADEAASLYFSSAVREAEESGSDLSVTLALQQRARFFTAIGRSEQALDDLQGALTAAGAIPDVGLRLDTELFLKLAMADHLQRTEPAAALDLLTDAIGLARDLDAERSLITALAARGRAHAQLKDRESAVRDLAAALVEVERQRWRLDDPGERRAFLSQARGVLEELVRLEWEAGRFTSALHWVERFRARVVGESLSVSTAEPSADGPVLRLDDVPLRTIIQAFLVADDELFIWWLSREGIRADRRLLGERDALANLVSDFRASLQDQRHQPTAGRRLAEAVLAKDVLREEPERLVFVPDAALHELPFAALPLADGSRVIEHASVVVAPSIGMFLQLSAKSGRSSLGSAKLLVISDVDHDERAFPDLARLPARASARILQEIAEARQLTGRDATPAAFINEARTATILHFAGHAVAETTAHPAGIVLSPGADGDGLLSVDGLRSLAPTKLRLAILAACGTGTGRPTALDGPDSIVQSFLAVGVESVVGTLWEVDDMTASQFFMAFLRRKDEWDPVRAAQLELLRSNAYDHSWAAFQQFGSGWKGPT